MKSRLNGYIIRDEEVLKDDSLNGLTQIVTEGTRVSKGEAVFRYYSNNEEEITNEIENLNKQIDEALEESVDKIQYSSEIINIENELKIELSNLLEKNNIQEIRKYQKKIDGYIEKKGEIAGLLSPEGSYIKTLVDSRAELRQKLLEDSKTISAPKPGIISYRVDGLEEKIKTNNEDFSYLNTNFFNELELNVCSSIPESKEQGKIVNNYYCYIACPMNTKNSEVAEIGDKVYLRLLDGSEIPSEIVAINEDEDQRIIIFKIKEKVENLIEYRKILVDIIWWKYSGWKVSNSALIEKNDLTYIIRNRAGIKEKILVKVLRQNETYSIVDNYTDEELVALGFNQSEILEFPKIKIYDEIIVSK